VAWFDDLVRRRRSRRTRWRRRLLGWLGRGGWVEPVTHCRTRRRGRWRWRCRLFGGSDAVPASLHLSLAGDIKYNLDDCQYADVESKLHELKDRQYGHAQPQTQHSSAVGQILGLSTTKTTTTTATTTTTIIIIINNNNTCTTTTTAVGQVLRELQQRKQTLTYVLIQLCCRLI